MWDPILYLNHNTNENFIIVVTLKCEFLHIVVILWWQNFLGLLLVPTPFMFFMIHSSTHNWYHMCNQEILTFPYEGEEEPRKTLTYSFMPLKHWSMFFFSNSLSNLHTQNLLSTLLSEWISNCAQVSPKFWRGGNWVWHHIWYYLSRCTTCPNDFGFEPKTFAKWAFFTFSAELRHFGPSAKKVPYSPGMLDQHLS